ncbi:MAG: KamA family radical SAM protein [Candidatus Eisenbacteria bacterium]|nr:KamA family radical SAM protein [Candidatus Eisenbacteria bacterium]
MHPRRPSLSTTPREVIAQNVTRRILRGTIRELDELAATGRLSRTEVDALRAVTERHPMRVTPYYLSLIDWSDPDDPIRRMAIPSPSERSLLGSYDTSGERENTKLTGLQHKYASTALVLVTNRCAVYCRHCFRKRLVGLPTEEILRRFDDAAEYIEQHPEITNVLLSGGDPLVLSTDAIGRLLNRLDPIEHLDFIRIGTRIPVVHPGRITEDAGLRGLLRQYSRPDRRLYAVTQFNHPRELTDEAAEAVDALMRAGVVVSNQAVLLKGVNDDPETLAELLRGLVRFGVAPYYVFQCRPVRGVQSSFQVTLKRGYRVVEDARERLDGHAKRFRYVMSHRTGKIEVVGIMGSDIYMRYHQAKNRDDHGRLFKRSLVPGAGWLDDLEPRDRPELDRGVPVAHRTMSDDAPGLA